MYNIVNIYTLKYKCIFIYMAAYKCHMKNNRVYPYITEMRYINLVRGGTSE